ncbi:MAG TPA: 4'-phosphopantetheinyl transferase superfamily protein [Bryobacteraceae bacterium]|nr:4'-phosphopantetheinyl transferase superfamily protein [Bryobacteraceae bacterium]
MLKPGEVHVWRVDLDRSAERWHAEPIAEEVARAARFQSEEMRKRYLVSHAALRATLAAEAGTHLELACDGNGKPYLANARRLRFNLSHSGSRALIGAALHVEVGVDIEQIRPMPEHLAIAERFFPPADFAELAASPESLREREFFRRWTRIEALLKARGVGLYGAGTIPEGEWSVAEVDAGDGFAAAVAGAASNLLIVCHDFVPPL